ncbi:hypothetical protein FF2_002941 [Malus domestica]
MSPERISGSTYDYSCDIWSLGLVVLECAIGRFPYMQSEDQQSWPSFYELLEAIVESPPPSAHPDQFSPEFCSFVSTCIQKDPQHRYHRIQSIATSSYIFTANMTTAGGAFSGSISIFPRIWSPLLGSRSLPLESLHRGSTASLRQLSTTVNESVSRLAGPIFVGGLPWKTQVDTMRRYFEQFGEILEVVVIIDKFTARSKGYGFSFQTSTFRSALLDPIRKRTPHFPNVAT